MIQYLSKWTRQTGRVAAIILSCAISTTSSASEKDEKAALEVAIDACFNLTGTPQSVETTLTDAGWVKSPDRKVTFETLFSVYFAATLNSDDLDYSYNNSAFMAASILSNSGLGPDQPGFTHGDLRLGVIGLKEDTPYCILSGPKWVAPIVGGKASRQMLSSKHGGHINTLGYDNGHLVLVSLIDKEKLSATQHNIEIEDYAEGYRFFLKNVLAETNLQIIPVATLEK